MLLKDPGPFLTVDCRLSLTLLCLLSLQESCCRVPWLVFRMGVLALQGTITAARLCGNGRSSPSKAAGLGPGWLTR